MQGKEIARAAGLPATVDRPAFQAELDRLRVREKSHTREGDTIAAARRRLPMVEVDPTIPLTGGDDPVPLLDAFEGRRQLIAYAVLCQGPYEEGVRYRDFMGWHMPWYSAQASVDALLVGRQIGLFHLVCYLREGDRVFETYWTTRRGAAAMDNSYALMDLTAFGRQEPWEDSPSGWPQQCTYTRTDGGPADWPPVSVWPGGRPIAQWPPMAAGHSDDLGPGHDGR